MQMYEILEILMIISFGASWPFNVYRSYKARTAKGKSLVFLLLILFGYAVGITGKLLSPSVNWFTLFFYILNFSMVSVDLLLYFRNRRYDRQP